MASCRFSNVIVEPHQRHVTGQSDLETALHTLIDHLREPFLALNKDVQGFHHAFSNSLRVGTHRPKNSNGGYTRIFAPKIDLRETANAYFIDVELPGIHDVSSLSISWRSERELLISGAIDRPPIAELSCRSHDREEYPLRDGDSRDYRDLALGVRQGSTTKSSQRSIPPYIVADAANGFAKNEHLHPSHVLSTGETDSDHFPLDIVDGRQLDEGDRHRVQVPIHHYRHGEVESDVIIGERDMGRFMRCFVFPHRIDTHGLQSEMANGLLRIGLPKAAGMASGLE